MKKIGQSLVLCFAVLAVMAGAALAAAEVNSVSALSSMDARVAETSLGDLIADAVRASQNADVAFVSASELKEVEIPRGKVSSDDISKAVSFPDDPIVVIQLTGDQIKKALEKSVSIYDQKNLGFLQVSGLKFSFKKASGDRVSSITVNGQPISPGKSYMVAMSNSMANGALGYWKIWTKDQAASLSSLTFPQAVDAFLAGKTSVDYSTLNRITVAK